MMKTVVARASSKKQDEKFFDGVDLIETRVGFDSTEKQDKRILRVEEDSGPNYWCVGGALSPEESSFSLDETALSPGVHVTGEVHIRPAPADHGRDTALYFDINRRLDPPQVPVKASKSTHPPDYDDLSTAGGRCIYLRSYQPGKHKISITLYLCPGKSLERFIIATTSLPIIVHPGINFSITNQWKLFTISHPITFPPPPSSPGSEPSTKYSQREIVIYSASGSITGTYPLFDLLSITTVAGSIDVNIYPRPALPSTPQTPASLVLASTSGSISANVLNIHTQPGNKIPDRIYTSRLSSISGSISAKLLHTASTTLLSTSGRIYADIYPTSYSSSSSFSSSITTSCQAGSTDITVHPDLFSPQSPIKKLSGKHANTSGSLKVRYPNTWEGQIQARTLSGRVGINWDGVRIIRDWGGKEVLAERGAGEGQLVLESISGGVELGGTTV